jgi:hypothetical protein
VRAAFAEAFARAADDDELALAERFLAQQAATIAAAGQATRVDGLPIPTSAAIDPARATALVDFCHALLNSNELLYVD